MVTLKSFNGHFHLFPIVRSAIKQEVLICWNFTINSEE